MVMMLMHMSIESLTKFGDVVFDASASTCTWSHTLGANNIKYSIWHMALHLKMVCVIRYQVRLYACAMLSDNCEPKMVHTCLLSPCQLLTMSLQFY